MSHPPTRLTAAALAAALGGPLLVQSPALAAGPAIPTATVRSAATVTAPSTAVAVSPAARTVSSTATAGGAAAPAAATAANFGYEISFPKHVRRGGSLVFTVKIRNRKAAGQHYVALLGDFPGGFRKIKVVAKPRSVKCSVKQRDLACWITSLDKGDSTSVGIRAWAGSRRGTATVGFGVLATKDPDATLGALKKKVRLSIKARTRIL
ncbi:hypothetical protein J2853_001059 [Streptosporangium lutulentum]|uniref:DUF11 domain-containing protein n=1 Tax=Streptosporangium lutulentum TaxID=1461250 RepID=A0ABT9Q672_9ACTN|nr:hypothetical protein [Streptosporangium lutulentum]MDP9841848.1 hypothetical protein [Streptosporangium lutulentum]